MAKRGPGSGNTPGRLLTWRWIVVALIAGVLIVLTLFSPSAQWAWRGSSTASLESPASADSTQGQKPKTSAVSDPVVLIGLSGQIWNSATVSWFLNSQSAANFTWQAGNILYPTGQKHADSASAWATISAGQRVSAADLDRYFKADSGIKTADEKDSENNPKAIGLLAGALLQAGKTFQAIGGTGAGIALAADNQAAEVKPYSPSEVVEIGHSITDTDLTVIDLSQGIDLQQLDQLVLSIPTQARVIIANLVDLDDHSHQGLILLRDAQLNNGILPGISTRQTGVVQNVDISAQILKYLGLQQANSPSVGLVLAASNSEALDTVLSSLARKALTVEVCLVVRPWFFVLWALLGIRAGLQLIWSRAQSAPKYGSSHTRQVWGLLPVVFPLTNWVLWALPVSCYLSGDITAAVSWVSRLVLIGFNLGIALLAAYLLAHGCAYLDRRFGFKAMLIGIAALYLLVVGGITVLGSPDQLFSVLGADGTKVSRMYGISNLKFSLLVAALATLITALAGSVAPSRAARGLKVVSISFVALLVILVDGLPQIGADFGGTFALCLTAGLAFASARPNPKWLKAAFLSCLVGLILTIGFILVDLSQPLARQSHVARYFKQLFTSAGFSILLRKSAVALATALVLALMVGVGWWLYCRYRSSSRSKLGDLVKHLSSWEGEKVVLKNATVAALVGGGIGVLLNDSGPAIAAGVLAYYGGLWSFYLVK